jgi:GAF domain-containing protein
MEQEIRRIAIHSASAIADAESDLTVALFACVVKAKAETAVVYRLEVDARRLDAAARLIVPCRITPDFDITLSGAASEWVEALTEPVQAASSQNLLMAELPEAAQHQLGRLLVTPLVGSEGLLGILCLGRRSEVCPFDAEAVRIAKRTARLLSAAIERESLQHKLLERKLMERAKGILQARRKVSEHQAYLLLRSESRRRRITMADLAKEIIETQFRSPAIRRSKDPPESGG